MSRIELRPHGPTSYTMSIDGVVRPSFWQHHEQGGQHTCTPVFPVGGQAPLVMETDVIFLPRKQLSTTWQNGVLVEEVMDVE